MDGLKRRERLWTARKGGKSRRRLEKAGKRADKREMAGDVVNLRVHAGAAPPISRFAVRNSKVGLK